MDPASRRDIRTRLARGYDLHGDKLRYLVVGAFNTAFGYGLFLTMLAVVRWGLGDYYLVAQWTAWVLAVPVGTLTMKHWVFHGTDPLWREVRRAYFVYLPGLGIASVLLWLTVELIGMSPQAGQLITIAATVTFSYVGHKYFTFRGGPRAERVAGSALKVLVVHEVEFIDKVVYEWQEFPEVLTEAGHDVAVLDYDSHSGWADIRRWGLGPKSITTSWRLDASKHFELLRMIGPPLPGVRRIFAALAAGTVMRRIMVAEKPDVVLLYAVPTCGGAVIRAARQAGCPVVFRSIDVLSQLVPRAIVPAVHLLERRVYARCDRILVANPRLDEYVSQLSGGRAVTSLLLSPVDTDRFAPLPGRRTSVRERLGIAADAPVAVFVGSLFGFVGLDVVLESWGRVADAVPGAHLLIVGGGPDEARLREIARRSVPAGSVTFTGMRPYDEVPELISAGDVGICPFEVLPVTRDVNPIKVMQYLSCGLPCVCTPLDGTTQVLPARESGVVYAPPGAEFTAALSALLGDPVACAELGGAGRSWVREHHALPLVTEQLVAELRSAADSATLRA